MSYLSAVQKGMDLLAADPRTLFVGQAMAYKGHAISNQVKEYPDNKKIEFPVAEEFQAGYCLGLAIEGYVPVSIYPRCNFAILACNQIVNHIDKWKVMGGTDVKVIIKMVVGSDRPLNPGHQHKANYCQAFKNMCDNITVFDLTRISPYSKSELHDYIDLAYNTALYSPGSYILVEDAQLYADG